MISIEGLAEIPVTPYAAVHPQLRTGDILLAVGNHWFSRLIQYATKSPFSHAGVVIVVPEVDRVLLLEAVEAAGVRMAPLRRLVWGEPAERYGGMVFVLRPRLVGDVATAACWGLDQLTQPYSYLTILALAWRILRGRGRGGDPDQRGYVCSEFAARWLALAGEDDISIHGDLVTPGDLWEHPSFTLLARIL